MLIIGAGLLTAAVISPPNAQSQQGPSSDLSKKIFIKNKRISPYPDPITIVEITCGDKNVSIGREFEAEDEWLQGATFKFRNDSERELAYLSFELRFPETVSTGIRMAFPISLGKAPGIDIPGQESLLIKPNQEFSITIDEQRYSRLKKFIETRYSLTTITRVVLDFGMVFFNDGIAWSTGEYSRQDPENPRRFLNVGDRPPLKMKPVK
jgi:hypothetical protein